MAYIDPESGCLGLQIVYDGGPQSGKTSSIRALGKHHDLPVVTPEEKTGRTVYFDWLEYIGGQCRGRPVACQTIAVPGQVEYSSRRRTILHSADAVIFVVDSAADRLERSVEQFEDLKVVLKRRDREIPIILQLNKRDLENAVPVLEILERLDPELQSVTSVATMGDGIQEAFVHATSAAIRSLRTSERLYSLEGGDFATQELHLPDPNELVNLLSTL